MLNVLVLFTLFWMSSSEILENNGTSGATINAEELVKLGRELHKPMLTLIGMAARNLHPCEQWTKWSLCSTKRIGHFGKRFRSKICNYHNNVGEINEMTENDSRFCEGFCPTGYSITKHGYCIKLNLQKLSHDDAEKQCQLDGGHMINMETQQKHDDVKQILDGYLNHVRIGGRRKSVSSPWQYEYGSQNGFLVWNSGQPNDGSTELCLLLDRSSRLWHDAACGSELAFLCEVTEATIL